MKRLIRAIAPAILGVLLIGFWGCTSDTSLPYGSAPPPAASTSKPNTVVIASYAFGPASMTVTKNSVVTFQNNDGVAHTATGDSGAWDTGNIPAGGSKTVNFTTAGTYAYHCTFHPMMTGSIVVQ